jgi:hypothetical protein
MSSRSSAASAIIATAPAAMTEENERVKERKRKSRDHFILLFPFFSL